MIRSATNSNKLTGSNKFVDETENRIGIRVETRKPGRPATEEKICPGFPVPASLSCQKWSGCIVFDQRPYRGHLRMKEDLELLHKAGFSESRLVEAAADFLRHHPFMRFPENRSETNELEKKLIRLGAQPSGLAVDDVESVAAQNLVVLSTEYLDLVNTSLRYSEVEYILALEFSKKSIPIELLRESLERFSSISAHVIARDLHYFVHNEILLWPAWQFKTDRMGLLPEIMTVLKNVRQDIHPIALNRYMTWPSIAAAQEFFDYSFLIRDPEKDAEDLCSPSEWLLQGFDPKELLPALQGL